MSVSFGAQTGLVLADARPQAGRCFLPLSASLLGRTVTIKDQFGAATASSIQIITNAPDTFEDGTSSRWINNDYGFMTIAATASNVWTVIGGTKQPTFQASTISTFLLATQTLSSVTAGISLAAVSSLSAATAYVGSGYISTLSTANLAAPSPYFSTVRYFDTGTGIYTSMSLSSSYIYLNGAAAPIVVPWQQVSTVAGLGTTGYVSTLSLTSSIAGLGTAGFVSTSWFHSTIAGLGTLGYISTTEDTVRTTSTVTGLGTVGYVSSQQGLITTSSVQVSSIAASMRGVQFLLAGSGSLLSTGIFYSQDGTTGSNATLVPNVINYYDAAVASNGFLQNTGGTEYVLAADLPNRLYVSSNLTSWLPVVSTPTATAKSIAFGSNAGVGTYIATTAAAGAASIQYRRNIDTGFMPIITAGGFSVAGSRAAYNPATDRWVAAGVDATASTLQYTTTLTTWTPSAGPTFSTVANSVIWAPGFSRFYAVGKAAVSTATIKMSADGITWSNANTGGFANCNIGALDIAYGNVGGTTPTLVAVGEGAPGGSISTIQWSTDGLNFSNATAGNFVSTNFAAGTAVAYSATLGQWMAAGGASSILTSADGKAWTNAAFQRPVGFTANRIFAPNTPFYTTLPIIAGPEALFQAGRQIVDTGYLNTFLATKSFGTSTFSTLTVAQGGTMAALLLNSNGSAAPTNYGAGVDTLTVQTTNAGYTGGIASMAFATATASYPLARIYAVDSASSGPANSQLVFQTVPLSASSFSSNVSYTGANQTFTVPAGVTTISVAMWGAGGGGASAAIGRGGAGAFLQGTLAVTPGQTLALVVGQGGIFNQTTLTYGGGGVSGGYANSSAGGGRSAIQLVLSNIISGATVSGATIVYTTSSAHGLVLNQPVVITGLSTGFNGNYAVSIIGSTTQFTVSNTTSASGTSTGTGTLYAELVDIGGGGAGGDSGSPNAWGGAASYTGSGSSGAGLYPGAGGTQTAGGAGSVGAPASPAGSQGNILTGGGGYFGGAGGGYYGGGGAGNNTGGGGAGGGSSYTSYPGFTLITGSNSANGNTAPATGYSGYQAGVAAGGAPNTSGGAGLILLASVGNAYAEAMRIGTTGNVGIGTTAPAALLDVAGTSRAQTASTLTMNTSTLTVSQKATLGSATIGGATVNLAGLLTSNTYGTGSDTLTIQTTAGGTSGGVASLYFGTPTYGYPLGRIAALDQGSAYDTSALIFQNATVAANSAASGATTFQYVTTATQPFTVPAGVTSITVKMWGGGGSSGYSGGTGGAGAYLSGTLSVFPGQVLNILVGGGGYINGGYGGGGAETQGYGAAGGGRSAIQTSFLGTITGVVGNGTTATLTTSIAHNLVTGEPVLIAGLTGYTGTYVVKSAPTPTTFTIASSTSSTLTGQNGTLVAELVDVGGGGGGSQNTTGGNATYTGTAVSGSPTGGGGGSQTAGGAAGSANAFAGSLLQGGTADYQGGGGGGYYGGGGGYISSGGSGGGGGSSWSGYLTNVSGANSTNGYSAPGTAVPGYSSGVAAGNIGNGGAGGNGLVIIVVPLAYNLAESMRISNNGYLGIGTTTPGTQLDVAGVARASTTITGVASVSSLAIYDSTTPSTGSLYQISSVLYYNNTAIGGVTAANIQAFTF